VIIYGVYRANQPEDTLFNLFANVADAYAYIESRKYPHNFYVQEMQVY
jgi:hypothetical protein